MTYFLTHAATQTGLTAMAATNMVTTLLASSQQTSIALTSNPVDTYSQPSNTETHSKALAAAAGMTTALVPLSAAAQVDDTPHILEIYGPEANDGIGDVPITELPTHEDHTPYIIGALITFAAPLIRLTLGTARLFVPALKTTTEKAATSKSSVQKANRFIGRIAASPLGTGLAYLRNIVGLIYLRLLVPTLKSTTDEAAVSSSSIQKGNRLIGRIAASPWGTGLAYMRNIGGLIYVVDSIKNDPLRVWSCYTPEFIILVGTLTSFIIRGLVYRSLSKLKKAGQLTNTDRQMHRTNALGLLPHRIPKPAEPEEPIETEKE